MKTDLWTARGNYRRRRGLGEGLLGKETFDLFSWDASRHTESGGGISI